MLPFQPKNKEVETICLDEDQPKKLQTKMPPMPKRKSQRARVLKKPPKSSDKSSNEDDEVGSISDASLDDKTEDKVEKLNADFSEDDVLFKQDDSDREVIKSDPSGGPAAGGSKIESEDDLNNNDKKAPKKKYNRTMVKVKDDWFKRSDCNGDSVSSYLRPVSSDPHSVFCQVDNTKISVKWRGVSAIMVCFSIMLINILNVI